MIKRKHSLMMWLIVGSEAIFFLSLIMAYVFFWRSGHYREAVKNTLDLLPTSILTVLLFSSSFTLWLAEHFQGKGEQKKLQLWLLVTIGLGTIFLVGQLHEYYGLLQKNFTLSTSLFGTTFYTLTGFHGLHVLIGIIILSILFVLARQGFFQKKTTLLTTVGIYWHFVDAVWLVVFSIVYVLPYL